MRADAAGGGRNQDGGPAQVSVRALAARGRTADVLYGILEVESSRRKRVAVEGSGRREEKLAELQRELPVRLRREGTSSPPSHVSQYVFRRYKAFAQALRDTLRPSHLRHSTGTLSRPPLSSPAPPLCWAVSPREWHASAFSAGGVYTTALERKCQDLPPSRLALPLIWSPGHPRRSRVPGKAEGTALGSASFSWRRLSRAQPGNFD